MDILRAEDKINMRGMLQYVFSFLLCDTSGNGYLHPWSLFLQVLHSSEFAVEFLFGFLPDAACIEYDKVRVGRAVGPGITLFLENSGHYFGIMHIHLTAKGMDICVFPHQKMYHA